METTFGVLSDLHLSDRPGERGAWHNPYDFEGVPARVGEAVAAFDDVGVDAILVCGDLTHRGETEALDALLGIWGRAARPVLVVAGNHDAHGSEGLARRGLSIARPEGEPVEGITAAGIHVAEGGWFGARPESLFAAQGWDTAPVVAVSHYPLLSHAQRLADRGMPYPGDVLGRAEVAAPLLGRAGPTIVVSGHIHARDASFSGPVLQLTQSALVEAPYEASIVRITTVGERVSVSRRALALAGPASPDPEPVIAPAEETYIHEGGAWHAPAPTPATTKESL